MEISINFCRISFALALTFWAVHAVAANYPQQEKKRIAQIAAHLAPTNGVWGPPRKSYNLDKLLEEPIPACSDAKYMMFSTVGDRTQYEKEFGGLIRMLSGLTDASIDGSTKALRKLPAVLDRFCELKSWTSSAHDPQLNNFNGTLLIVDLFNSAICFELARMLFYLKDKLPPETVAKIRAEMEHHVFTPYLQATRGDRKHMWSFFALSNWCAVCHSGVVRAALAYYEDPKQRAEFIEGAERGMPYFLQSFLADGYCTEGMGYWNYGFGNFLELTAAVKEATGGYLDFSKLDRAETAMRYAFNYRMTPTQCPIFADGGGGYPTDRNVELGVGFWPALKPLRDDRLAINSFFPNAQIYIGRGQHLQLGIKGGGNDDAHNHNDVGSWTMIADGEVIAGDPGGEIYTARTFSKDRYVSKVLNSYGHPVPVIAGELQGTGAQYAAKVVSTNFTETVDEISFDLTGAYDVLVQKKLGKVTRAVAFKRGKTEQIMIADTFTYKKPQQFETAIITYARTTVAKDGKSFVLERNGAKVEVKIGVKGGGEWKLVEEDIENPNCPSPHRIAVRFNEPVTGGTVGWRFTHKRK